jgi:hypothetical protein
MDISPLIARTMAETPTSVLGRPVRDLTAAGQDADNKLEMFQRVLRHFCREIHTSRLGKS